MTEPSRSERKTQNRVIDLFTNMARPGCLGYRYFDGLRKRIQRAAVALRTTRPAT